MKLLIVGDHTVTLNWGGRGQSLALYQMLMNEYEICSTVEGTDVTSVIANSGYINTLLPSHFINFFLRVRDQVRVVDWYMKFEELLGARDFVTDDPEQSAENLLRYKAKSSGLGELYDKVQESDAVVINGEGAGVFTTPFRRDFFFYLTMIELGVRLKKKVFYVNGVMSDCPITGRNHSSVAAARRTLAKCNGVSLRDLESLEFVRMEMPEVKCDYHPDALFTWFPVYNDPGNNLPVNGDFLIPHPEKQEYFGRLDFSKPYICLGGSSLSALDQNSSTVQYAQLAQSLKTLDHAVYLTPNCGGDRYLYEVSAITGIPIVPTTVPIVSCGAILANARLFISGRFHATIFASLGGTPCVYLAAHSHKMHSLQKTLECGNDGVFSPVQDQIPAILDLAQQHLNRGETLRNEIREVAAKRSEEARGLLHFLRDNL